MPLDLFEDVSNPNTHTPKANLLAADKVLHAALVEPIDELGLLCVLELLLQRIKKHAAELLHVVLLKGCLFFGERCKWGERGLAQPYMSCDGVAGAQETDPRFGPSQSFW